jgi:hypothetical protein
MEDWTKARHSMKTQTLSFLLTAACGLVALEARADGHEAAFRALYKELVETNTTLSAGSCTLAAERMAAHLRAAGFPESDLHLFTAPDHPKEGGLVAVYPGRDKKAPAILLLAHLDTVEAKREDWTRDPFTLIEENGNFYARGAVSARRSTSRATRSSWRSPAARRPAAPSMAPRGWRPMSGR